MDSNLAGLGVCSSGNVGTSAISDCSSGHGGNTSDDNLVFPEILALAFSSGGGEFVAAITDLFVREANHDPADGFITIADGLGIGIYSITAGVVDLTGLVASSVYFFTSNFTCAEQAGRIENEGEELLEHGDCQTSEVYLSTMTVSQIPIPAAGWLLLAGVGGLAAMRRRKS